jgi:hypothetical protein
VVVLSESCVFPNLAETTMNVRFLKILCMNDFKFKGAQNSTFLLL